MKQLTIRGVPDDVSRALEAERRRRGISLNQTVLELLRQGLGLGKEQFDNGLASLAGTWNPEELERFHKAVEPFERIDEELF